MGILDDLKMGLGIEEKTRDYYDRTAKTVARNDGADAADKYRERIGFAPGGGHYASSKYGNAPHYSDTSTGPQMPSADTPGILALLARLFGGPDSAPTERRRRQVRSRRRGATQAAAPTSGFTAPTATKTPLTDMSTQLSAGPNLMEQPENLGLQGAIMEEQRETFSPPDPDDVPMYDFAVRHNNYLERHSGYVPQPGMPAMPIPGVDVPFARQPPSGGDISPEAEEAAYQQWLASPQGQRYKDVYDYDGGFSRRMYNISKSLKAGKF